MRKVKAPVFLMLVLVVFFIPTLLLSSFGYQLHTVMSGSMRPSIKPGDLVVTHLEKANSIKVGDVVLLFSNQSGSLQAHRIISADKQQGLIIFVTKGDANPAADPAISEPSSVPISVKLLALPKMGFVVSAFHSWPMKALLAVGFLLIILLLMAERYAFRRERAHNQEIQNIREHRNIKENQKSSRKGR